MYSVYSKYYDEIETTSQEVVDFIISVAQKHFPQAKSILEIGCGTGNNLISLKEKFEVSGLDLSAEMLTLAKQKLSDTKLYIGDMSNFNIDQKFDLIISMYDSINHLENIDAWKDCFSSVTKHLNKSGLFIFDINTLKKLNTMSQASDFEVKLTNKNLKMKVSKVDQNKFNWNIKVFSLDTGFNPVSIEEDNITELSFEIEEIQNMLRDCNLEVLETTELFGNPATENSNRIYFVCRIKA